MEGVTGWRLPDDTGQKTLEGRRQQDYLAFPCREQGGSGELAAEVDGESSVGQAVSYLFPS